MNGQARLTAKDKAAILVVSLGKDYAAKLYQHLTEDEVEQLTLSVSSVRRVDPEVREVVIREFYELCMAQRFVAEGGIDYAREILDKAFGPKHANELIEKISSSLRVRPFDFVRKADSAQVLSFIQNEHPQTIALILSYLDPRQSAYILSSLPLDSQTEVLVRIAEMGASAPEYIKEAERILENKLVSLNFGDHTKVGGIDCLVQILNSVDRGNEKTLLKSLEETHEELAEEVRNRLFIFEDVARLGNQAIQRILKDVDNHDLAIALKGATKEVKKVIFDNISKRMQQMIEEDLEIMGPVRVRDVEEAQQKIVNTIRTLDDAGEIIIYHGREDEVIV